MTCTEGKFKEDAEEETHADICMHANGVVLVVLLTGLAEHDGFICRVGKNTISWYMY